MLLKKASYIVILSMALVFSCKKNTAREIAGVYDGWTHTVYYQNGSPNNKDETTYGEFTITRSGKYVLVLGEKIHADSLADGEYTFTLGDCESQVNFNKDTLSAHICYFGNSQAYHFIDQYGVKIRD